MPSIKCPVRRPGVCRLAPGTWRLALLLSRPATSAPRIRMMQVTEWELQCILLDIHGGPVLDVSAAIFAGRPTAGTSASNALSGQSRHFVRESTSPHPERAEGRRSTHTQLRPLSAKQCKSDKHSVLNLRRASSFVLDNSVVFVMKAFLAILPCCSTGDAIGCNVELMQSCYYTRYRLTVNSGLIMISMHPPPGISATADAAARAEHRAGWSLFPHSRNEQES